MFRAKNSSASVLDIGSSKITALCGGKNNGRLAILGQCTVQYSGFMDGEFLDEADLAFAVQKAISSVEAGLAAKIKKITVGVPAEFCYSITKKVNITFAARTKITQDVLDEAYASAVENFEEYSAINVQTIYCTLDDGIKMISPLGQKAITLSILVNVIYAHKKFISLFNQMLAGQGIEAVNYIASPLATCQGFFGGVAQSVCVVDIGYLSSSVAFAKGAGLENMFSFSCGGAQVEIALMDAFALTFKEATELKKNLVLSLDDDGMEYYETSNLGKKRKVLTKSANAVAKDVLLELAFVVGECLKKATYPETAPVYLTGGGISQIAGAKDLFAQHLGREVKFLSYEALGFNNPFHSSCVALLLSQISS